MVVDDCAVVDGAGAVVRWELLLHAASTTTATNASVRRMLTMCG
jgi:hypothetical protein